MRRLEGKTALITGCNRGIGKAILELFASEGANIIACTRTQSNDFQAFCKNLENRFKISIYHYFFDLSDEDSIKSSFSLISKEQKKFHILVNNAGIAIFPGLMKVTSEDLHNVFRVNYFAPVLMVKYALLPLMKSGNGIILNIASVAGLDPQPGNVAYGASKAALINFSKTISQELAQAKIRVNCIAPGLIDTDMNINIVSENAKDINNITLKRLGMADEVAKTALFLCSEDASYITGQVIRVDGGM